MYFDSETAMVVISGVPGKEMQYDKDGKPLEGGPARRAWRQVLPSWVMSKRKKDINDMAGGVRALCQGNCAPNHYWDMKTNSQDKKALFEQMEREVKLYGIDSWKWYCHTDPGRSGDGFQLDDEKMTYPFYEKSKELGLKFFSVHKGFSYQSRTLGHLANPKDVEKAALDHPDLTFVIYHSALQHGPSEPEFEERIAQSRDRRLRLARRADEDQGAQSEDEQRLSGNRLVRSARWRSRNPEMCQHLIGRNIKLYGADHVIWGTDCLWWGSPQWAIDAFKRFQISDELCEKFGYKKLTKEDKAKIFGLNAAKIYGVDAEREAQEPAQGRAVEAQDGLPRHGRHARKRRLRLGPRRRQELNA